MQDRDINTLKFKNWISGSILLLTGFFLGHWLYYEFFNYALGYENYHKLYFLAVSGIFAIAAIAAFPGILYGYNKMITKRERNSKSYTTFSSIFFILSIPLIPFYLGEIFGPLIYSLAGISLAIAIVCEVMTNFFNK